MFDSGNAHGKHLHFEVQKGNTRINPTNYLDKSFEITSQTTTIKYKIGDTVKINGVYISSTSDERLTPAITTGKITRIIPLAKNPYLLEDGKIGWVNDNTITNIINPNKPKYLTNQNYTGFSIVDGLNQINVNSSYQYRSELAKLNDIPNYTGTGIQNTQLLNLLKKGQLKY